MAYKALKPMVLLVMMDEQPDISVIRSVAPDLLDIHHQPPGAFEDDAGMYPPTTGLKHYRSRWHSDLTEKERELLLQRTNILAASIPFPLHLRDRMPNLEWVEFVWAGVSDFKNSDLWNTNVTITSGRGSVQTLPIAEMVVTAALSHAKQLSLAFTQTQGGALNVSAFHLQLVEGKTMGIVGLGGIGSETARLAKGFGMKVLATRRSATQQISGVPNVDTVYPTAQLEQMLSQCDFVAVTAPLTPETYGMFDDRTFDAMKRGAFLVNVARGELVDEDAMKRALKSKKLGGAYLDVYSGERERLPNQELMAFPNVIITPHNSGNTDIPHWPMAETFAANLRRFINNESLHNQVDFSRGY